MSKRKSQRITSSQLEIPTITVPCQFKDQAAAFLLGARDAFMRSRMERNFAYLSTETAYAAGVVAGLRARTIHKGATR